MVFSTTSPTKIVHRAPFSFATHLTFLIPPQIERFSKQHDEKNIYPLKRTYQEAAENCIMSSFIFYAIRSIVLG
jgi:hypothetical protein